MTRQCLGRSRLGIGFARAASVYWLDVFSCISCELKSWQRRAQVIPDESLRNVALGVQHTKRGNLEGAAAFAAFVPREHRPAVIRAQVALQAIYDYVDTLAERPSGDPIRNSRGLHQALRHALEPDVPHIDYYAHHRHALDGGYLRGMIEVCRASLSTLPSRAVIAAPMYRFAERIIAYQTFNVPGEGRRSDALKCWASRETPPHGDLRWWETAASAGSSLGIFALLALAAEPHATTAEAHAIENVYFPWIGALHSLLDSLIDIEEDMMSGQPSLITHYASKREAAARMRMLATESVHRIEPLPRATNHMLILAGMVSFYLSASQAYLPQARLATEHILDALGVTAAPAMLILRARRVIGSLNPAPGQSPKPD